MALIKCCFEASEMPEVFDSIAQKCTDSGCMYIIINFIFFMTSMYGQYEWKSTFWFRILLILNVEKTRVSVLMRLLSGDYESVPFSSAEWSVPFHKKPVVVW